MLYLRQIRAAESTYFQTHGRYGKLSELWPNSAIPAERSMVGGNFAGFRFDVEPKGTKYTVTIWPASKERIVSLYSDETGIVRVAFRGQQATASSPVIHEAGK
jgi:hypothetical protein